MTLSRIMVPLDGSELAETALPYVEALAKALSLEVVLTRAVAGGFYAPSAYYPYVGADQLETEVEQPTIEYLTEVADKLRADGLDVQWKLLRGPAAQAVVELAQRTPQDIIVLTTHGRSGLSRWVLGSVTEALVRASGDPVLIIPANN